MSRRKSEKTILYRLILTVSLSCALFASDVGTVRGKVTDLATGRPLPGVNVLIEGTTLGAATDSEGDYLIISVPQGVYTVTASMIGYKVLSIQNIRVIREQTVWANFGLEMAVLEGEEVVVTAERPLVEQDEPGKKITIDSEEITSLPIRDMAEIFTLQAGVVEVRSKALGVPGFEDRGIEEIHVRGGRADETGMMIDGMYLENPIYGGVGVGSHLNTFSVETWDYRPGWYPAEYGDAMSGMQNIITRSGGEKLEGGIQIQSSALGEIQDRLRNYGKISAGFGGAVPFTKKKLRFWLSGDLTDGAYTVMQFDDSVFDPNDPGNRKNKERFVNHYDRTGGWRKFGFRDIWDIYGKLDFHISPRIKLAYSYWQSDVNNLVFSPSYLFNDDGRNILMLRNYRHALSWRHQISERSFYTIHTQRFTQERELKVRNMDSDGDGWPNWFEFRYNADAYHYDSADPSTYPSQMDETGAWVAITTDEKTGWSVGDDMDRWLSPDQYVGWKWQSYADSTWDYLYDLSERGGLTQSVLDSLYYLFYLYEFIEGGDDRYWHESRSLTDEIKLDFQSQLTKRLQMRTGFDWKLHTLMFDEVQLPWYQGGYTDRYGTGDKYGVEDPPYRPNELGLYIQGKYEVPQRFILQTGLRGDMVNYQGRAWEDPRVATPDSAQLIDTGWNRTFSPRIGLSHIITDRATFTFNYGVFYQNPTYRNIFINSDALTDSSELFTGLAVLVGNSLMTPRKVTTYEFGFNHEFVPGYRYQITAFAKDYSNQVGTEVVRMGPVKYTVFVNYDYGSSRGVDMLLQKRVTRSSNLGFTLQYLISAAKANRADAWEGYRNSDNPYTMPKKEILMYYDRTHDVSLRLTYHLPEGKGPSLFGIAPLGNSMLSLTSRTMSGLPYTPIDPITNQAGPTNSERMPATAYTNLWWRKSLKMGKGEATVGLLVRNLFNRKNPIDIYERTGSAEDPGVRARGFVENGQLSSTYYDRPWNYGSFRSMDVTLEIRF